MDAYNIHTLLDAIKYDDIISKLELWYSYWSDGITLQPLTKLISLLLISGVASIDKTPQYIHLMCNNSWFNSLEILVENRCFFLI